MGQVVTTSKPVTQLIREGESKTRIEQAIAIQIVKYASMLHIGGNLLPHEPVTIAQMLIQEYPLQSIEDFTLMLQRGVTGRYGKVFGFDISVVFGWMGEYMAEWAEEKESQINKEKNKLAEHIEPEPGQWSPETEKLVRDFQESLRGSSLKSVPQLSQKEIYQEGQLTPPKQKGVLYPSTTEEDIIMRNKRIEYGRMHTDLHTGKIKEGSLSFDEWIKMDRP